MIRTHAVRIAAAFAVLFSSTPTEADARDEAGGDLKRRVPKYQYFHCTAVHKILAEAYKQIGDRASETVQKEKAARRYEEGKRDLIEVGKDPSEADGRVQKYIDQIVDELETDPTKVRVLILGCAQHFPS